MSDSYSWRIKMTRDRRPLISSLIIELNFRNPDYRGQHRARPGAFFDALADAYEANPEAVVATFRSMGIVGSGLPKTNDT